MVFSLLVWAAAPRPCPPPVVVVVWWGGGGGGVGGGVGVVVVAVLAVLEEEEEEERSNNPRTGVRNGGYGGKVNVEGVEVACEWLSSRCKDEGLFLVRSLTTPRPHSYSPHHSTPSL